MSCGDFLALVVEPSRKEDGTLFKVDGEAYRVERAAFFSTEDWPVRYFRVCFRCKQRLGFTNHGDCICNDGPSFYTCDVTTTAQ